ncbi:MAG: transcription antitermination factor NusB [Microbacterium sp.]
MVSTPRRVAFEVLRKVSSSDAYANLLLPQLIERAHLRAHDAALATELTYGTLRRIGTYDAIIRAASDRELLRIDAATLDALRLGAHQLLATRVASHAAVNETVALVRAERGQGAAGFANAVLRRISRDDEATWMARIAERARSDDERLSLQTAHPVWIIRALRRALAAEGRADELDALLAADNEAPGVTLAVLPPDVVEGERTTYSPIGQRLDGGDPAEIVQATGGRTRVQDEGSQLVALALARLHPVAQGERWLDLCAGPGGKTAVLAAEARLGGADLEANEIVEARAGLVRKAVTPIDPDVIVHEQDGRDFAAERAGVYDRILVDAPCTGLGALRRRSEARWRKQPSDIAELTGIQEGLLNAAVGALKPGGVVAYVTCSPHLAETVGVVRTIIDSRGDVEEIDATAAIQSVVREPLDLPDASTGPSTGSGQATGTGAAQLWPHRHGTDGMFLALLRRTNEQRR